MRTKCTFLDLNQFGDIIRQGRERKGYSQREAAELAGISQRALGFYEKGEREPSIETLKSLIQVLDIQKEITAFLLEQTVPDANEQDLIKLQRLRISDLEKQLSDCHKKISKKKP